jgi:hypothetical protein
MLLATPLKRVQASPLTWEFVATKARQMRFCDEALEARVVAKMHAHMEPHCVWSHSHAPKVSERGFFFIYIRVMFLFLCFYTSP